MKTMSKTNKIILIFCVFFAALIIGTIIFLNVKNNLLFELKIAINNIKNNDETATNSDNNETSTNSDDEEEIVKKEFYKEDYIIVSLNDKNVKFKVLYSKFKITNPKNEIYLGEKEFYDEYTEHLQADIYIDSKKIIEGSYTKNEYKSTDFKIIKGKDKDYMGLFYVYNISPAGKMLDSYFSIFNDSGKIITTIVDQDAHTSATDSSSDEWKSYEYSPNLKDAQGSLIKVYSDYITYYDSPCNTYYGVCDESLHEYKAIIDNDKLYIDKLLKTFNNVNIEGGAVIGNCSCRPKNYNFNPEIKTHEINLNGNKHILKFEKKVSINDNNDYMHEGTYGNKTTNIDIYYDNKYIASSKFIHDEADIAYDEYNYPKYKIIKGSDNKDYLTVYAEEVGENKKVNEVTINENGEKIK